MLLSPHTINILYDWYESICDALVPVLVFSAVVYLIVYLVACAYY